MEIMLAELYNVLFITFWDLYFLHKKDENVDWTKPICTTNLIKADASFRNMPL